MQNKSLRIGPVGMNTTATNIANPNVTSLSGPVGITLTQPVATLKHIRITNKSTGAVSVSLFIGATGASAANTEFAYASYSIPANSWTDWYGNLRLESGDFLTGLASAATSLTFEAEGEIGFQ